MEITIYFDSKLKNRQVIKTQHKVEAKPRDIVNTIYPNWYGFQVDEGNIVFNPSRKLAEYENT